MNTRIGALPKDIKQKNDEQILRAVADLTTFTVQDISKITNISRLTVTRAIERLMDKEIVVSLGKGSSTNVGGKKPQEFALNQNRYVICVSPCSGRTTYSVIALNGDVISAVTGDFLVNVSYEEYLKITAAGVRHVMEQSGISCDDLFGIMYCVGGIVDHQKGIVFTSNYPQWGKGLSMADDIRAQLGMDVYICIENVAKVSAGVLRFNSDFRNRRTAVLYADYGISITLLEDGKIPETPHSVIGELGHMSLEPSDPETCGCGTNGCFELLVSSKRLHRIIGDLPEEQRKAILRNYDGESDIRVYLLEEEKNGNTDVLGLCNYMADYMGLAFHNVYLAFDPDFCVLMGVFSHGSDRFLNRVRAKIRQNQYLSGFEVSIDREERELVELLQQGGRNLLLGSILEENGE